MAAWTGIETMIERVRPEFILMQCGADSLAGDPITHLNLSARSHAHAAARLCHMAARYCPVGYWPWVAVAITAAISPKPGRVLSRRWWSRN